MDYSCRDFLGGCPNDTAAEGAATQAAMTSIPTGIPKEPAIVPGMTSGEIQAAVDTYNAQVPSYSGGTNYGWLSTPNPNYDIIGQAVINADLSESSPSTVLHTVSRDGIGSDTVGSDAVGSDAVEVSGGGAPLDAVPTADGTGAGVLAGLGSNAVLVALAVVAVIAILIAMPGKKKVSV